MSSIRQIGLQLPAIKLVSVIVPVYNAADTIGIQLQALSRQTYRGEWELVVSDNGSTDETGLILRNHPFGDSVKFTVVDSSKKPGTAYARNRGVACSKGEFLAFTDADDLVHEDWLAELVSAATSYDAVAGEIEIERLNSAEAFTWRPLSTPGQSFTDPQFLPYFMGCNFGVWRSVLNEVGGFDEAFKPAGEDVELAWRIQKAGFTLGLQPKAIVSYRLRSSLTETCRQLRHYGVSDSRLYAKFREHGMRRMRGRELSALTFLVLLQNPLLPTVLTRTNRGMWLARMSYVLGRVQGYFLT